MFRRKRSTNINPGYYHRRISFFLALILTVICLYGIWVDASSSTPDYTREGFMVVFIIFGWAVVLLVRIVVRTDVKQKEVEYSLNSHPEDKKQGRSNREFITTKRPAREL
jgi:hypothetical protein